MSEPTTQLDPCGCTRRAETGMTIKPCVAHYTPHERLLAAASGLLDAYRATPGYVVAYPVAEKIIELRAAVAECEAPPTMDDV